MHISEAFEFHHLNVIVYLDKSSKTEESYLHTKKRLLEFFGDIHIEKLDFKAVRSWKIYLDKGRMTTTVRGYLFCLRGVLKCLAKHGYSVMDYELIEVPKRPKSRPYFLFKEEVQELIDIALTPSRGYLKINRYRNAAIISHLYGSSLRNAELCSLNRDSIRHRQFNVTGKGAKDRLAFVDDRTELLLSQYLALRRDNLQPLYLTRLNTRLTPGGVRDIFSLLARKSGKPVHPHTARHSFGANWTLNDGNIRKLQVIMGHESLETTQIYAHVVDPDLEASYKKAHTF